MTKPVRNAYALPAKLRKGAGFHKDKKNDGPGRCAICGVIVDDGETYCDACRPPDPEEDGGEGADRTD